MRLSSLFSVLSKRKSIFKFWPGKEAHGLLGDNPEKRLLNLNKSELHLVEAVKSEGGQARKILGFRGISFFQGKEVLIFL